ncbi:MAG: phage/plasmid primase, P4 family, partial [Pirellulaceae bacterium]
GSESGSPSVVEFTGKNGKPGFTGRSGSMSCFPLSCETADGGTGNWYSKEALWLSFEREQDCSNGRAPDVWKEEASEIRKDEVIEELLQIDDSSFLEMEAAIREDRDPAESMRTTSKPYSLWFTAEDSRNANEFARRFADRYLQRLRYCPEWRKFLVWTGSRWKIDSDGSATLGLVRSFATSLWKDFGKAAQSLDSTDLKKLHTFLKQANQVNWLEGVVRLVRADPRIHVEIQNLDSNNGLLNVTNGTVDLETGELRPHSPADLLTSITAVAYEPEALDCPEWRKFIETVCGGDTRLARYLQQLLGYSLHGDCGEHVLPICWGSGCNGKSCLWSVVSAILGVYGDVASPTLLLGGSNEHKTEKADLYGKRFVMTSETTEDAKLDVATVKELTGDDVIKARRMREDFWTCRRTTTFWMATNHRPSITPGAKAIWRRLKLIPFTVDLREVLEPSPDFHHVLLEAEGPAVLRWMVDGYLDYKANGFAEPVCVSQATREYQATSDDVMRFVGEDCEQAPGLVAGLTELFEAYTSKGGYQTKAEFRASLACQFDIIPNYMARGPFRNKTVVKGLGLLPHEDDFTDFDVL